MSSSWYKTAIYRPLAKRFPIIRKTEKIRWRFFVKGLRALYQLLRSVIFAFPASTPLRIRKHFYCSLLGSSLKVVFAATNLSSFIGRQIPNLTSHEWEKLTSAILIASKKHPLALRRISSLSLESADEHKDSSPEDIEAARTEARLFATEALTQADLAPLACLIICVKYDLLIKLPGTPQEQNPEKLSPFVYAMQ